MCMNLVMFSRLWIEAIYSICLMVKESLLRVNDKIKSNQIQMGPLSLFLNKMFDIKLSIELNYR